MRATEVLATALSIGLCGCAADEYLLGALGSTGASETDADPSTAPGGSSEEGGDTASTAGTAGTAGADVPPEGFNPLDAATPLKTWQDQGLAGVAGGAWDGVSNRLLVADLAADAVLYVDLGGVSEHWSPAGAPVGLGIDVDAAPLVLQGQPPRIVRAQSSDAIEVLAEGSPLQAPSAIVTAASGQHYIADRLAGGILRLDPEGGIELVAPLAEEIHGLALAPDETTLYVSQPSLGEVAVLPVLADGSLDAPTTFASLGGAPLGLCVDDEANLYVTNGTWADVFAPNAGHWGTIDAPAPINDCTFGQSGSNSLLLLTSATAIYSVGLSVSGPP